MNQRLYKWVDGTLEERDIDTIDVAAWLSHGWSLTVPAPLEAIEPTRKKTGPTV